MRPSEIHNLPSQYSEPWYDAGGNVLAAAFGIGRYELDDDAAREAGGPTVEIHRKLQRSSGSSWWAEVYSLTFQGELFGVYSRAGDSRDEYAKFYVANDDVKTRALLHLSLWRAKPEVEHVDVTDDHMVPEIVNFEGVVTREIDGEIRMVPKTHFDSTGVLLFNDGAYRQAFDQDVRPAFQSGSLDFEEGMQNAGMRAAVSKAVMAGIPGDVEAIEINQNRDLDDVSSDWVAAAMKTWEGTFAIVVPGVSLGGSGFSALNRLFVSRLGGPERYAEWVERADRVVAPVPGGVI